MNRKSTKKLADKILSEQLSKPKVLIIEGSNMAKELAKELIIKKMSNEVIVASPRVDNKNSFLKTSQPGHNHF